MGSQRQWPAQAAGPCCMGLQHWVLGPGQWPALTELARQSTKWARVPQKALSPAVPGESCLQQAGETLESPARPCVLLTGAWPLPAAAWALLLLRLLLQLLLRLGLERAA